MIKIKIAIIPVVLILALFLGCGEDKKFNNNVEPPVIIGLINAPDSVYARNFFVASVIVDDPQGLEVQARFEWGNGSVSGYTSLAPSGTALEMPYAYNNSGIYTISVTARNSAGLTIGSDTVTHQITVISKVETNLINDLLIHDNRLFMTTQSPVNIKLTYQRENAQGKFYKGYSAEGKRSFLDFPLPVENGGLNYEISLQVESNAATKDTTFTFISTDSSYPLLRVDFVDVRQGDGILIQTPEGHAIAVDGGYGSRVPAFSQPAYWNGAGYPFMLNYVIGENIGRFRYLVETHNHMDHWSGLSDIRDFGIPYDFYLSPDQTYDLNVGDFLNVYSAVTFEILNINVPPGASNIENNRSVVLRIEYGEIAYILTGDIEAGVENYLFNNNFNLSADVLKVAHHGSQSSSRHYFLNAVFDRYAKVAVMSFGTGNPYNHPHNIERFADYEVFGTNQPSENYFGDNYHFNVGDIQTYTDGYILIVGY